MIIDLGEGGGEKEAEINEKKEKKKGEMSWQERESGSSRD